MRLVLSMLAGLLACGVSAAPYISEFMAADQNLVVDEDLAYPDWIEIYNPDLTNASLQGWYLTDDAGNLTKWRFPTVTIGPRSNIIVFASDKNRTSNVARLHTNFKLNKSGDYLALVRSNGTTIASQFAPAFPPQVDGASYGVTLPISSVTLVATGTPCTTYIPVTDVTNAWRDIGYDDSAWTTGTLAVGFFSNTVPNFVSEVGLNVETMRDVCASAYIRVPMTVTNPAAIRSLILRMRYDDGFACWFNGKKFISANAPTTPTNTSVATTSRDPTSYLLFDISPRATNLVAGANIFAIHGLNQTVASADFFILPQLIAGIEDGSSPQTNFFLVPTPGLPNGGADSVRLPQAVTFSPPPKIFTGSITVSLAGAISGQTIRYSTNGLPPAASSPLYTGPLVLTTSTFFRAAVFGSSNEAGPTVSAMYTLASPAIAAFTSALPLIVIHNVDPLRQGVITTQDVKVACWTFVTEPTNGFGRVTNAAQNSMRSGVSPRGSSTGTQPKKSYALEFWDESGADTKAPLLGMGAESDWVLYGPYSFDRSYMHNAMIFELSRQMGRWAPRTRFCEVFVVSNMTARLETNDYVGIYVAMEKIDIAPSRVDIPKLTAFDVALPQISGGYVFKIDRADADEFSWKPSTNILTNSVLVLTSEKAAKFPTVQKTYLTNTVLAFEQALLSTNFTNLVTGYNAHIKADTWIDHHIINVMTKNVDALRLSAYMFKDRRETIECGPAWDFDRSLDSYDGRDDAYTNWSGTGDATDFFGYGWWGRLFLDPDFYQRWIDRWQELRRSTLANSNLIVVINSNMLAAGSTAATRDSVRWGQGFRGSSYTSEVAWMRTWLTNRTTWIDAQFTAPPVITPGDGVVTAGTSISISGTNILYALGTDPRAQGGAIAPEAVAYAGTFALTSTTYVVARCLNGTNWSGPVKALYLVDESFATNGDLAVTEINYHPLGASPAELAAIAYAQPEDFEFIELRNVSTKRVNLYGCTMPDGYPANPVTFGPWSLGTGEIAVVASRTDGLAARYGSGVLTRVAATWTDGTLADNGERITLLARNGSTIFSLDYGDTGAWPNRADGGGSSLEWTGGVFTSSSASNAANWRASSEVHGTPGTEGAGPDTRAVINEVLTHTDLPLVDAIELKNLTATNLAIGGWYIADQTTPETVADYRKYRIPAGTNIPPFGYVAFDETLFNPNGLWNSSAGLPAAWEFRLDAAHGDDVWLIEADASSNLLRFVDHAEFGAARNGESIGRWPDGTGTFLPMRQRTLLNEASTGVPRRALGATNGDPRVGPIIVSEVHHSPNGANTNALQFIELYNAGKSNEVLSQWTLRGQADFDFTTQTLAPSQLLVVVSFDPSTNPALPAAFQAAYGISTNVVLIGPWQSGNVLRTGGRVQLNRADDPPVEEPTFYPQVYEDGASYTNLAPWPIVSGGFSLTRRGTGEVAEIHSSWKSAVPSPGCWGIGYASWQKFYFPTGGVNSADSANPDGDANDNLWEYATGYSPLDFDAPNLFSAQPINGQPSFVFSLAADRPDVQLVPESAEAVEGPWLPASALLVSNTLDRLWRRAAPPPAGTNFFLRLRLDTVP